MSLADLIRKTESVKIATATLATLATQERKEARTVATVATVTVANPANREFEAPALEPLADREAIAAWLDSIGEDDAGVRAVVLRQCEADSHARRWYFDPERAGGCFAPEREPQDCRLCRHWRRPGLSDGYCTERTDLPHAYGLLYELPLDGGASCARFTDWRGNIGTTRAPIAPREPDDDRRTCEECANLTTTPRGPRCLAAARGERPNEAATRDYLPMLGMLWRCTAFVALAGDPDQRPSAERWPYLTDSARHG